MRRARPSPGQPRRAPVDWAGMPAPAPELLRYQRTLNRNSAGRWGAFASHRERVTALIADAAGPTPGTVALLGAGNCNDVDLVALAARHGSLHLVDLDHEALQRARDRQPAEVAVRLALHPSVDLSGGLDRLSAARTGSVDPGALAQGALAHILAALPGPFDTVVSTCVLSQIAQSCRMVLGVSHPGLHAAAEALVSAHLRALIRLTRPGGTAVLVTDVVSSETYPLEELAPEQPLARLLDHLEATDNVLTGTRPRFLRRFFTRDPVAGPLVDPPPRQVDPWLWRLGDDLTLLTYALVLSRRS
jgi:hypothetical protein